MIDGWFRWRLRGLDWDPCVHSSSRSRCERHPSPLPSPGPLCAHSHGRWGLDGALTGSACSVPATSGCLGRDWFPGPVQLAVGYIGYHEGPWMGFLSPRGFAGPRCSRQVSSGLWDLVGGRVLVFGFRPRPRCLVLGWRWRGGSLGFYPRCSLFLFSGDERGAFPSLPFSGASPAGLPTLERVGLRLVPGGFRLSLAGARISVFACCC